MSRVWLVNFYHLLEVLVPPLVFLTCLNDNSFFILFYTFFQTRKIHSQERGKKKIKLMKILQKRRSVSPPANLTKTTRKTHHKIPASPEKTRKTTFLKQKLSGKDRGHILWGTTVRVCFYRDRVSSVAMITLWSNMGSILIRYHRLKADAGIKFISLFRAVNSGQGFCLGFVNHAQISIECDVREILDLVASIHPSVHMYMNYGQDVVAHFLF